MQHTFSVKIAVIAGIPAAVILQYISFWVKANEDEGRNYEDGRYWTYLTVKDIKEKFPYLSENQVRLAIKKLKENNLVHTGNYNHKSFDHTTWFTLSEKAWSILKSNENRGF